MKTRLWICAIASCLLGAIATANDQLTSGPGTKLSSQDAQALAEWTRRQAELAASEGGNIEEARALAKWAREQADSVGRPATVPTLPVTPVAKANFVEPAAAPPAPAVAQAATLQAEEPLPAPMAPPVADPQADPAAAGPMMEGVPPVLGEMWNICCACCEAGVIAGVEGTFLAPINEPHQQVVLSNLVNGDDFTDETEYGLGGGVRTWIGLQNCAGTGFVFRFWTFGDENIDPNPVVPIDAEPAFSGSAFLHIQAYDVEVTQRLCWHDCRIYTSFGARYATLERNQTIVGYGDIGDVSLTGLAMGANEFSACGVTYSISGVTPIHHCCLPCGFSWYYGFRGSTLWGETTASALTDATAVVKAPIGAATANSRDKAFATVANDCLYTAEVFAGIQCEYCLCCVPAALFYRAGFEYQHWETGDARADTSSFAFLAGTPPPFGGRTEAFARAHDGDLDLVGFAVAVGLTY